MSDMLASAHWYMSGAVIGWTAVAVALGVGIATVIMWQRGFPRRLLVYSIESTSLVASGRALPKLEINYEDQALQFPTLVTLRVESRSRRDIGSADFDAGRSLVFNFGAKIIARVGGTAGATFAAGAGRVLSLGEKSLSVAPVRIPKGRLFRVDLLTEGAPRLTCQSPLLNVDVRRLDFRDQGRMRGLRFWAFFSVAAAFWIAYGLLFLLWPPQTQEEAAVQAIAYAISWYLMGALGLVAILLIGGRMPHRRPSRGRSGTQADSHDPAP